MKRAAIAFFAGLGLAVAPGALASDTTSTTTVAPAIHNAEVDKLLQKIGENTSPQDMEDAQKALQDLDLASLAEVMTPIFEKAAGENVFAVVPVLHFAALATLARGGGLPDSSDEEFFTGQQRPASGTSSAHDGQSVQTGHADNASSVELRPSVAQENLPPEAKKLENTSEKGKAGADVRADEEDAEDEGPGPRHSLGNRQKARRYAVRNAVIVGLAILAVVGIGYAGFKVAPRRDDPVN
ncbi:hypothetical protein CSUI_006716 [Cystoisospora suis]|uniref:Transmembrane protein n=1 Tax=Cystoisospora suis TaxID=483139 RepID=A0A2C6KT49_9APIC|nr:hypothetical protein CSUI_006716 [Cystoisospora suis]